MDWAAYQPMSEYATAQRASSTRGELRAALREAVDEAFDKVLHHGGCDAIFYSLRPSYERLPRRSRKRENDPGRHARRTNLRTAKPAAVTAWQGLDTHLATIDTIGRIAAQFGPRTGNFPQIEEYALGDGFRLDDRAIWCTDGPNLELDSAVFRRPGPGTAQPVVPAAGAATHVDSARDRYREWASGQWERQHAGPVASVLDENGKIRELPRPKTPIGQRLP